METTISLIISYYKHIPNLKAILSALNEQSVDGFEVILSEDDNNEETIAFLKDNKAQYKFPIQHLFQKEDLGFRKNSMLNRSIQTAKGTTIVFIDGDCVPHRSFIEMYQKHTAPNRILYGRRVMLGEAISKKTIENKNLKALSFMQILFSDTKMKKEAIYSPFIKLAYKERGLVGCNWGIQKQHLYELNGFDEDYQKAGVGEDTDIEWRMKSIGLEMYSMKNRAIVYHLYHARSYAQEDVHFNYDLFQEKKHLAHFKCLNGIEDLRTK